MAKGIGIISSIEQKAKVAAVTDGKETHVQIEGTGKDVTELVAELVAGLCEGIYENSDKEQTAEKLKEVERFVKTVTSKALARFAFKHIEKELKDVFEGMEDEEDEDA